MRRQPAARAMAIAYVLLGLRTQALVTGYLADSPRADWGSNAETSRVSFSSHASGPLFIRGQLRYTSAPARLHPQLKLLARLSAPYSSALIDATVRWRTFPLLHPPVVTLLMCAVSPNH